MKKYVPEKAQKKFEKKLNKIAYRLDRADEKGHELSIIFLRSKIAKLANERAKELEKFETNGVAVKPDLIFDKEYIVNFKVRNIEPLSAEEAEKICGDRNYRVIQTAKTQTADASSKTKAQNKEKNS